MSPPFFSIIYLSCRQISIHRCLFKFILCHGMQLHGNFLRRNRIVSQNIPPCSIVLHAQFSSYFISTNRRDSGRKSIFKEMRWFYRKCHRFRVCDTCVMSALHQTFVSIRSIDASLLQTFCHFHSRHCTHKERTRERGISMSINFRVMW